MPDGDQENGGPPTADDLADMVEICLNKLPVDQRQKFAGHLATILAGLENNMNANSGGNYRGTTFRNALGGTNAGDRRSKGNARTPAQDTALRRLESRDFLRRFPDAMKITVIG